MSKKGPAFRDLAGGAESARLADLREPHGQLPVPTLEERARLFLRAVHGERDLTGSEYARAHRTILNAMAADIAARSKSGMPGEPLRPTVPPIGGAYGDSISTEAMWPPADDQPMYVDAPRQISPAYDSELALQRYPGVSRPSPRQFSRPVAEAEFSIPRSMRSELGAFIDDVSLSLHAPMHKPAKRRVFIGSAAVFIFAGLCVLAGLALYRKNTQSESVTAQSASGGISVAGTPISAQSNDGSNAIQTSRIGADAPIGAPSLSDQRAGGINTLAAVPPVSAPLGFAPPLGPTAAPVATAPRVATVPAAGAVPSIGAVQKNIEQSKAALLERARIVIAAGDIETTRAALSKLANELNAWAALELGKTYDPNILDALGVRDFPADIAKARAWYERAQLMGSPDAAGLLESLEPQRTTTPLQQKRGR